MIDAIRRNALTAVFNFRGATVVFDSKLSAAVTELNKWADDIAGPLSYVTGYKVGVQADCFEVVFNLSTDVSGWSDAQKLEMQNRLGVKFRGRAYGAAQIERDRRHHVGTTITLTLTQGEFAKPGKAIKGVGRITLGNDSIVFAMAEPTYDEAKISALAQRVAEAYGVYMGTAALPVGDLDANAQHHPHFDYKPAAA